MRTEMRAEAGVGSWSDGGWSVPAGTRIDFGGGGKDYLESLGHLPRLCLGGTSDCIESFSDGGTEVLQRWIEKTFHPERWVATEVCEARVAEARSPQEPLAMVLTVGFALVFLFAVIWAAMFSTRA